MYPFEMLEMNLDELLLIFAQYDYCDSTGFSDKLNVNKTTQKFISYFIPLIAYL